MATETAEPDTIAELKGELEQVRSRTQETEDRLNALVTEERDASQTIGAMTADGEDVEDLREERRRIREDIEDFENSLPYLENQVEELEQQIEAERRAAEFAVLSEEAERVVEIARQMDDAIDEFVARAHEFQDAMRNLWNMARQQGFGLPDRFRDGTLIRWRVEWEARRLGFRRPPSQARGLSVTDLVESHVSGLNRRLAHALDASDEDREWL